MYYVYGTSSLVGSINHVGDNLYIGDIDARAPDLLQRHDIRHVISVLTKEERFYLKSCTREDLIKVKEYSFDLDDDEKANILEILPKILAIVDENEENILVHCRAGISRSASVVIGILLRRPNLIGLYSTSFNHALRYLRTVRCIVDPNEKFVKDLLSLETIISREED